MPAASPARGTRESLQAAARGRATGWRSSRRSAARRSRWTTARSTARGSPRPRTCAPPSAARTDVGLSAVEGYRPSAFCQDAAVRCEHDRRLKKPARCRSTGVRGAATVKRMSVHRTVALAVGVDGRPGGGEGARTRGTSAPVPRARRRDGPASSGSDTQTVQPPQAPPAPPARAGSRVERSTSCSSYAFDSCAISRHWKGEMNVGMAASSTRQPAPRVSAVPTRHRCSATRRCRLRRCGRAARRQRRTEPPGRGRHACWWAAARMTVVERHQREDDGGVPARARPVAAAEPQPGREGRQQVDVDDRHPVDGEPVPVERAERRACRTTSADPSARGRARQ